MYCRHRPACVVALTIAAAVWIDRSAAREDGATSTDTRTIGDADVVINARGTSYDSQPAFAPLPDGTTWIAWRAYHRSRERILARRIGPKRLGKVIEVAGKGVHDRPHVVATGPGALWVFWSTREDGRWRVVGRRLDNGRWQGPAVLSDPLSDAIHPVAVAAGEGRLALAFCAYRDGRFHIRVRVCDDGTWGKSVAVSTKDRDSFRPCLASHPTQGVWVFWDTYASGNYAVMGRRVLPKRGRIERVSGPEANGLKPVALGSETLGLCVAWLRVTDVIGGEGAIDQRHTLEMAVRRGGGWEPVTDAAGQTEAAALTHGLLARMAPKPGPIWGYLGRRRHPMLLEHDDAVWLVWERKGAHTGSTPSTTGELIGRAYRGRNWGKPVILHKGFVDYHLGSGPRVADGKFQAVASELPRQHRRIYHRLLVDVERTAPFKQGKWTGWRPVTLPLEAEIPRHAITVDGRRYRLYWADTHCHSGLSADAEGEPDELLHYAHDRARLDVVVIQENDEIYNCPLTESEYALGCWFAGCYSREGRFLALPGYEWTQRYPKDPKADPADHIGWPWTDTFPNHRTIIYPPAGGPIVRWTEVGSDINRLYQAVEKAGGLLHTQHPTWVLADRPCEVGIEVTSGWGIYIRPPKRIHEALSAGFRMGFVGTSDSHRRTPGLGGGLTGIYAESLTAEAVLAAYRARRVFATNGSHIVLDSRLNGRPMGEHVRDARSVKLRLFARGTRPIAKVTLIRDGKELERFTSTGDSALSVQFRDEGVSPGTHWYYWRVAQQGRSPGYPSNVKVARGHLAWSSPHWVTVVD